MKKKVLLSNDEIDRIVEFQSQLKISNANFGQKDSGNRDREIMLRDMLVGKAGEVALQKFLKDSFDIHVDIDWEIYDKFTGDAQDFLIHHHRFEVKSIKRGNWFLIEQDTLARRKAQRTVPHYYVLVHVPFNEQTNRPLNHAYILGYCSLDDLASSENLLLKGSELPDKKVKLLATNFGMHNSELRTNWPVLFYQLKDIESSIYALRNVN